MLSDEAAGFGFWSPERSGGRLGMRQRHRESADSSTARHRGPLPPVTLWQSESAEAHLAIARRLRALPAAAAAERMIDPWSRAVLEAVHIRALVPCWLLATARARWSELRPIALHTAMRTGRIRIHASKGSKDRQARVLPSAAGIDGLDVAEHVPVTILSYEAVCRHIRAASADAGVGVPSRHNSGTHIFRHFWATWRASQGASLAEISADLGHFSPESTERYIHETHQITRF